MDKQGLCKNVFYNYLYNHLSPTGAQKFAWGVKELDFSTNLKDQLCDSPDEVFNFNITSLNVIDLNANKDDGWISVEDGLPEDDDYYLIYPYEKYAGVGANFWPYKDEDGHKNNTFEMESEYAEIIQIYPTHWMPLPEPPVK